MNSKILNVCICMPASHDNRSADEQARMLDKFYQLDQGIRFDFVEDMDKPELRILRSQPDFEVARELVVSPSAELREALARANVILCADLPFDMQSLAPNLRSTSDQ